MQQSKGQSTKNVVINRIQYQIEKKPPEKNMNQKMTHKKQTPQKSVNNSQKKVSEENKDIQQPVSIPQSMHNDNNVS